MGSPLYDKQEGTSGETGGGDLSCKEQECTPPVSTTMKSVINLEMQYFVLYSALAGVRSFTELTGTQLPMITTTLNAACMTVNYAPMLSVLFLGTRMRAVQLSGGEPDKYHLPQPYVKSAMWFCVCAVQIQTLIVLVLPLISGGAPKVSKDGNFETP